LVTAPHGGRLSLKIEALQSMAHAWGVFKC
jgi:hypothetical protein